MYSSLSVLCWPDFSYMQIPNVDNSINQTRTPDCPRFYRFVQSCQLKSQCPFAFVYGFTGGSKLSEPPVFLCLLQKRFCTVPFSGSTPGKAFSIQTAVPPHKEGQTGRPVWRPAIQPAPSGARLQARSTKGAYKAPASPPSPRRTRSGPRSGYAASCDC